MQDPRSHCFYITEPTTLTIVTPAGAWVIDKKTFKIIKRVPEKPQPDPWSTVLEAGAAILHSTEGVRGLEELHAQAARLVATAVEAAAKQAKTTPG